MGAKCWVRYEAGEIEEEETGDRYRGQNTCPVHSEKALAGVAAIDITREFDDTCLARV